MHIHPPSFREQRLSIGVEAKTKKEVGKVFEFMNESDVELVLIGIPTKDDKVPSMYDLIKHYCDQKYGIISCCFNTENITEVNMGAKRDYLENFLRKRAIQSQLPFLTARTMVMGVVVSHSDALEKVLSLVSAAVGSYDEALTKYAASIRMQKKERDETVKQLDSMLLKGYQKHNYHYPDNIFVFRDGVSETQLEQVKEKEIPLIWAAI
ncbi:hypothetical protein TYRP_022854 [Tyrophagus putrescentiae]|nr:hypothetical protein TYRP_022854 [Tyrophagus putrescentiae]